MFKIKCYRIVPATAYKSALWEIEYADGVFTNVYAADRAEAIAKVCRDA